MKKQQMHQTHTSGKATWALPVLLASLCACAGPAREGDANWAEFEQIMAEGLSQIEQMDAEVAALNAKLTAADETIEASKDYIAGGVGSGTGDVPTRWETMKEVEDLLEKLHLERPKILEDEAVAVAGRADYAAMHRQNVDNFLWAAWKTTREGAVNLRANYGFGASTDSRIDMVGTQFGSVLGNPGTPFSGYLAGDAARADNADIGVEYYLSDGIAVEAGVIFGSIVRNDEPFGGLTLAYDDDDYMGFFFGGKYCPPINVAGGGMLNGRTRLFVNARVGLMDGYSFTGTATEPGGSTVGASFSGESYVTLGLGGGVLFAWTDHIGVEFGISLIESTSGIGGTWNVNGDDGGTDSYNGTFSTDLSMTKAYIGFIFGF